MAKHRLVNSCCKAAIAASALLATTLVGGTGVIAQASNTPVAPAFSSANAPQQPYHLDWDARIPTRDGIELSARIYRPAQGTGPWPVVFQMSPYNADRLHETGRFYARNGIVFASIDSRGRGNSEGQQVTWFAEGADGYDAITWLAAQPWSNGKIGSMGASYTGKNNWSWAALNHPNFVAMAPSAAGFVGFDSGISRNMLQPRQMAGFYSMVHGRDMQMNFMGDLEYWRWALSEVHRGAVAFRDFDELVGFPDPQWKEETSHPEPDDFWAAAGPVGDQWADIQIPVMALTGIYESAQLGTIEFYRRHVEAVSPAIAARHYLVMGPWTHSGTRNPQRMVGGLDFGVESLINMDQLHVDWWNHTMNGAPRPDFLKDSFTYYLMGPNEWRGAPTIEAATTSTETLFLSSPTATSGSLADVGQLAAAAPDQAPDSYVDDPAAPGYWQGFDLQGRDTPRWLTDIEPIERINGDGLIYDSEPFETARDLIGRPEVQLYITMDTPDADIHVQLYEVLADGSVVYLSEDRMRARYRHIETEAQPVVPGQFDLYNFDRFYFVARRIAAGSRLRMVIFPVGNSLYHPRNRNSGGVVAEETAEDNTVANIQIRLGDDQSRITIPFG
jgi:putative CocE/NonD family hydrolase